MGQVSPQAGLVRCQERVLCVKLRCCCWSGQVKYSTPGSGLGADLGKKSYLAEALLERGVLFIFSAFSGCFLLPAEMLPHTQTDSQQPTLRKCFRPLALAQGTSGWRSGHAYLPTLSVRLCQKPLFPISRAPGPPRTPDGAGKVPAVIMLPAVADQVPRLKQV